MKVAGKVSTPESHDPRALPLLRIWKGPQNGTDTVRRDLGPGPWKLEEAEKASFSRVFS